MDELYRRLCRWLYGSGAGIYDKVAWVVSLGRWKRWAALALDHQPQGLCLELGPGTGMLSSTLRERKVEAMMLEYSPDMIRRHESGRILRGDGRQLPFSASAFHSIFASFPESYLLEGVTLAECRRVLKPEGVMVVIGAFIEFKWSWLNHCCPFFYRPVGPHLEPLRRRAQDVGLELDEEAIEGAWVRHLKLRFRVS